MRPTFFVLVVALLLVPECFARNRSDWKNVQRLKPGSEIMIVLSDGRHTEGCVRSATDSKLEIVVPGGSYPAGGRDQNLDRRDIEKIMRVHTHDPFAPDPKLVLALAVAGGAVIGTTVGAIGDAEHGNNGRWLAGGLGGAGIGIFAWMAFYAGVSVFDLATLARHRTVIYENPGARTLARP
jgi:hypothetical protein